jgi:hypothetical protein
VIPETRKDEFVLVRPSVAFLIQQATGNVLVEFVDVRSLCNIDRITSESKDNEIYVPYHDFLSIDNRYLAVNNNDDPSIAEGGSHWFNIFRLD